MKYLGKMVNNDARSLRGYEEKVFSQNGEDGITVELVNRLYNNTNNQYYVEFGVQEFPLGTRGFPVGGDQCNTRILREKGWSGLLMDGWHENENINLRKEFVTKENITSLFKKYGVPKKFELLSVDVDFNDFYILHRIIKEYLVDIIIVEYNAHFLPHEDAVVKHEANGGWDGYSNYFGASLLAFKRMLNKYNYSLVYTENQGVDAFFVNNDILGKNIQKFVNVDDIDALYSGAKYGHGPRGGHMTDTKNRKFIKSDDAINDF